LTQSKAWLRSGVARFIAISTELTTITKVDAQDVRKNLRLCKIYMTVEQREV